MMFFLVFYVFNQSVLFFNAISKGPISFLPAVKLLKNTTCVNVQQTKQENQ